MTTPSYEAAVHTPLSALYASLPTLPNGQHPEEIMANLLRLGFYVHRLPGEVGSPAYQEAVALVQATISASEQSR